MPSKFREAYSRAPARISCGLFRVLLAGLLGLVFLGVSFGLPSTVSAQKSVRSEARGPAVQKRVGRGAAYVLLPVRSCLLYNVTTGKMLYEQNARMRIPPASLTKIMTLYLALDQVKRGKISLKRRVKISKLAANTRGSSMHLRPGERVPLAKLLIGTVVPSGNDAAMAVAQAIQPNLKRFVQMMNARAKKLGMTLTEFKNPTGLPARGQLSAARDMLTLSVAYLRSHPEALKYHKVATFSHGGRVLTTTNPLLGAVCGVNGLKTGWTIASGYNIIVTAERNGVRLVCVVMGGRSRVGRDMTARKLIEAGFRSPNSASEVKKVLRARRVAKAR